MNFTVLSSEITRLLSSCCSVYKETLTLINRWDIRRSRTTFQDVYCICHCRGPMLLSGLPRRMIYLAEKLLCLLGLERSELCHLRLYVLEDVDAWTDCKAWHVDRQTDKTVVKLMSHTYTTTSTHTCKIYGSLKETERLIERRVDSKVNVD